LKPKKKKLIPTHNAGRLRSAGGFRQAMAGHGGAPAEDVLSGKRQFTRMGLLNYADKLKKDKRDLEVQNENLKTF
jgi:hypothetical protein